ncbi:PE family protein PE22 [Mycobacterium tuberculosis KT-0091]|nr:PE family protein PE22 [Mycobacterium tuberculosis KT-0091]
MSFVNVDPFGMLAAAAITWITMWVIAVDSFGTEHIATTRGTNLVHKSAPAAMRLRRS